MISEVYQEPWITDRVFLLDADDNMDEFISACMKSTTSVLINGVDHTLAADEVSWCAYQESPRREVVVHYSETP